MGLWDCLDFLPGFWVFIWVSLGFYNRFSAMDFLHIDFLTQQFSYIYTGMGFYEIFWSACLHYELDSAGLPACLLDALCVSGYSGSACSKHLGFSATLPIDFL